MRWGVVVLSTAMLVASSSSSLLASEAGLIPSVESLCDAQSGAAYGLCVAACESALIEHDTTSKAFQRVSENFTQITGESLPCLTPTVCPLDIAFGISGLQAHQCGVFVQDNTSFENAVLCRVGISDGQPAACYSAHATEFVASRELGDTGTYTVWYQFKDASGNFVFQQVNPVSAAENAACQQLIRELCH